MAWACFECGCSEDAAERKRKRLGLPVLYPWAKTCSPPCARARERRLLREKYGPGTSYHRRVLRKLHAQKRIRRGAWRCVECGCDYDEAQAKRRRRGEQPTTRIRTVTSSAECRHRHRLAVITRWQRKHPEQRAEQQRRTYARWVARGK